MAVNYCEHQLEEGLDVRHLPTPKRKVPALIPERASIPCNMTGGLIGGLGRCLGCGT